ncbi:hypothetical protein [Mucilaginibacter sp. FT3.2]|uniref:hypothetical protein n=1 Tax=Mucilaginibacter sp. FT3.2 TaxID=2723090 RepID=UPI00161B2D42|nr:hypothetical protein [Mucilaginibacter sp. FT3.2]MBB6234331.1 hypothetical protein [Mucilaginibacter sp. FT3.2]
MSEYKDAVINQQNNKKVKESNQATNTNQSKNNLESQGPSKKNLKILNDDGSFADLPDKEINGAGAQSASITE